MEEEWLNIFCALAAGITVTDVTDSHLSWQHSQLLLIEHLIYKAVSLDSVECTLIINCYDTATLLSSMLKGVQAIICKACSILNTVYTNHTTLVMKLVVSELIHL